MGGAGTGEGLVVGWCVVCAEGWVLCCVWGGVGVVLYVGRGGVWVVGTMISGNSGGGD